MRGFTITLPALLFLFVSSPVLGQPTAVDEDEEQQVQTTNGDPYNIYGTGMFQEVYIDEDFNLFKIRTYQGLVPGRTPEEGEEPILDENTSGSTKIKRIGFEQRELFSRIFILADRAISPWVYDNFVQAAADPSIPFQIYVELAKSKIPKVNDKRPLVTRNFNTPVMSVEGTENKDGVRVIITLKREARYLPVQVGKVLYLDVER
jgi:hypothetical protein